MKAMKAMKAMKTRPRKLSKKPSGAVAAAPVAAAPSSADAVVFKQAYGLMWYKNNNGYGIREKYLGKQQVARVGGVNLKQADLKKIAEKAIRKLEDEGCHVDDVKEWCKEQVSALRA